MKVFLRIQLLHFWIPFCIKLEQCSLLVCEVFQWALSVLWLMLFLAVTLEETAMPNTLSDGLYWMLAI